MMLLSRSPQQSTTGEKKPELGCIFASYFRNSRKMKQLAEEKLAESKRSADFRHARIPFPYHFMEYDKTLSYIESEAGLPISRLHGSVSRLEARRRTKLQDLARFSKMHL